MLKSNAEIKDDILKLLLKFESSWTTKMLYSKLNEPNKSHSHFLELIKEMIGDGGKYFNHFVEGSTTYLKKNEFTQEFLDEGGFTKASKIAVANTAATVLELQDEKEAKRVTREKEKIQLSLAKFQKKTFWYVFALGLIGGVYSLYKIYQAVFDLPNNVTEEQMNPKIDFIQNRLEQLENDIELVKASIVTDTLKIKDSI